MEINLYDVVLLKNGLKAQVVEILKDEGCYVVDVDEAHGWSEDDTIFAMPDEIIANLETWRNANRFHLVVDTYQLELPDKSRSFTHLEFEEDIPSSKWQHVIINGTTHKPVNAFLCNAEIRHNWLVINGQHDYVGMLAEFV